MPTSLFLDRPLPYHRPRHSLATLEVARTPDQLQPHLERLNACDDVSQLFGALVDLFIGLAPDDEAARRGALDRYGHALSDAERRALAVAVEHGLAATTPIPDAPHSLLTCGVTGRAVLVATAAPDAPEATEAPVPVAAIAAVPWTDHRRAPRVPSSPPRRPPVRALVAAGAVVGMVLWRRRARARRS